MKKRKCIAFALSFIFLTILFPLSATAEPLSERQIIDAELSTEEVLERADLSKKKSLDEIASDLVASTIMYRGEVAQDKTDEELMNNTYIGNAIQSCHITSDKQLEVLRDRYYPVFCGDDLVGILIEWVGENGDK